MPSPPSRHMKNNIFSSQYSDEIDIKSISRAQHGNFVRGLELYVHFQIGLGFTVIGGISPAHVHCICPPQTLTLEPLISI